MPHDYIICIDFDGVLHSYVSGWQGADQVADPPVPGAIEWLESLVLAEEIVPVIYSSRSSQTGGIKAMQDWLLEHGLHPKYLYSIGFPVAKPAAFLTIDDRCIRFEGLFPRLDEMINFKPWNEDKKL